MDNQLVSPLLDGGDSAHYQPSPASSTNGGYHAVDAAALATESGTNKFGEYVSRAKARANNTLSVCCGIPFHMVMLVCIMFLTFGSYWYGRPRTGGHGWTGG